MARKPSRKQNKAFNAGEYLESEGTRRKIRTFRKGERIFGQGDGCESVLYVQAGSVKMSVTSHLGKEAVVALLGPTDFFGEGCIAGQAKRVSTATALTDVAVLEIEKREINRVIHDEPAFADRFVAHMVKRKLRVEEDLVDQLFNSSEKRLARALLIVARYGNAGHPLKTIAPLSQETLAKMIGTTRSRVSFFMNKFRKMGFIKYNGGIHVNDSLLRVVLRD